VIKEIIVYKIQDGKEEEFTAIKNQIIEESYSLNGLYSSTTAKSLDQENVYVDAMIWDSKEAAIAAFPEFEKLPTASQFMGLMVSPPLFHHFMKYVPDKTN